MRLTGAILAMLLLVTPVVAAEPTPAVAPEAAPGATAAPTLVDLRASLKQLGADLQGLRAELNASGQAGFAAAGGDKAIDRMNTMEAQLAKLTGQTEELRARINRIVTDGTNRIGDVEFRLCELDETCDLGALATPELGTQSDGANGLSPSAAAPPSATRDVTRGAAAQPERATTRQEQIDFERAQATLDGGDFAAAADQFASFADIHAGGPLAVRAMYLQGRALDSAGDTDSAAQAWLQVFAADPNGPLAPDALLGLSRVGVLGGDPESGCVYLDELNARFPDTPQAAEAQKRATASGCVPSLRPHAVLPGGTAPDPEQTADAPADGG